MAMRWSVLLLLLLISSRLASSATAAPQKETFAEEAIVTPLPDGLVLVNLQFTQQAACRRHCTTFPKAVSQLAGAIPFQSVELSLTQGRWHYERWGAPLLQAKPAGAVLRAHFAPTLAPDTLPGLWGNLSHALGGLFCASLNFVARPEATAPLAISMQPVLTQQLQESSAGQRVQHPEHPAGQQQQENERENHAEVRWVPGPAREQVLYASLPQEASCTENLTPWLKLLPCRDAAGLGRLLTQRGVVFGADYHSMQVNIDVQRDQHQHPILTTLRQSLTLVLRSPSPNSLSSSTREPPKPGTFSDISLTALLGSQAPSACPVADTSRLMLQLPHHILQEQREKDFLALISIPAHSTAHASAPEADTSAQQQQDDGEQEQGQHAASNPATASRAAAWEGPGFNLQPAPDAAAALAPTGPACAGMLGAAAGLPPRRAQDTGDVSTTPAACSPLVLYIWDLHRNPAAPNTAGAGAVLRFAVQWQQQKEAPADAAPAESVLAASAKDPQFSVARFITGTGQLHGGMTLQLTAVHQQQFESEAAGAGGNVSVCILQVVPWYIRLWLHTLRLSIDGQVKPLEDVLLPSYISPAQDRQRPLVLDLCLAVPRSVHSITLTAQFTKAFLRMLEHPPDAHRGFDVPAAVVTVGEVPSTSLEGLSQGAAAAIPGSSRWQVYAAPGSQSSGDLMTVSPLMEQLMQQEPSLVYSPGLVVPLAVPDFSMPYNVICLTSTVLAVFMGGVLNALLWRPGRDEREAADPKTAIKKKRKKIVRVVVLIVSFMAVAVYYDTDLQTELLRQARSFGLYDPGPLPGDEL